MAIAESDPEQSTPHESTPQDAPARPIEVIATEWLRAERQQTSAPSRSTEATARKLAAEYEQAIRNGSQEDLRLAWKRPGWPRPRAKWVPRSGLRPLGRRAARESTKPAADGQTLRAGASFGGSTDASGLSLT